MKYFIVLIVLLHLFAISSNAQRPGIKGQVYLLSTESTNATPTPYQGVPLEVFVYPLISQAEVDEEGDGIVKIYSQPVKRIFSKWNGSFKVKLKPGAYSVFVRYQNRYYGNLIDSRGNLSPAIISGKAYAWTTITLGYQPFH